jgi:hypothetical protein
MRQAKAMLDDAGRRAAYVSTPHVHLPRTRYVEPVRRPIATIDCEPRIGTLVISRPCTIGVRDTTPVTTLTKVSRDSGA